MKSGAVQFSISHLERESSFLTLRVAAWQINLICNSRSTKCFPELPTVSRVIHQWVEVGSFIIGVGSAAIAWPKHATMEDGHDALYAIVWCWRWTWMASFMFLWPRADPPFDLFSYFLLLFFCRKHCAFIAHYIIMFNFNDAKMQRRIPDIGLAPLILRPRVTPHSFPLSFALNLSFSQFPPSVPAHSLPLPSPLSLFLTFHPSAGSHSLVFQRGSKKNKK